MEIDKWQYKATGDMTLSVVVAQTGQRVFTVQMLSAGTMKAGLEGDRLARSINDLSLLAQIPRLMGGDIKIDLAPHPEVGNSPFPWSVILSKTKCALQIEDARKKKIAESLSGKRSHPEWLEFVSLIQEGIEVVNARFTQS
jgi:hypothetical protein